MARILIIPDTQFPYHHPDTFDFLHSAITFYLSPNDKVVHIGDENDWQHLSFFTQVPDQLNPSGEVERSIEAMKKLYSLRPEGITFLLSNHGRRPIRKANAAGIHSAFIKDIAEMTGAPKTMRWVKELTLDGIYFHHGDFKGLGNRKCAALTLAQKIGKPSVLGHQHIHPHVVYANTGRQLWGMNVGCLIDRASPAFAYGDLYIEKPVLGLGLIDSGIPLFIPMKTDKHDRWTGELL